jgi:predicted LPLAT superfamily acyltransferase
MTASRLRGGEAPLMAEAGQAASLPGGAARAAVPDWRRAPERGSPALLRLMLALTRALGWRAGAALLHPISAYFLLSSPRPRAASRRFLGRALGRPARWGDLYRLYHAFSATILDRVWLASGQTRGFDIEVRGLEALRARLAEGRGCLLIGAHLGSFEAMRAVADAGCPVPLSILMHEDNAARVKAFFDALGGEARAAAIIPLGRPDAMLRVREALARGELVGLLADRAPHDDKLLRVPFLGQPAPLPTGPHVLAALLRAPVMLAFGLRRGPRRYEVRFEPFATPARADVAASVAAYAARLEALCREAPENWFNFHDFWREDAS